MTNYEVNWTASNNSTTAGICPGVSHVQKFWRQYLWKLSSEVNSAHNAQRYKAIQIVDLLFLFLSNC